MMKGFFYELDVAPKSHKENKAKHKVSEANF